MAGLLERERQLEVLHKCLADSRRGEGRPFLGGEAGAGESALLRAFADANRTELRARPPDPSSTSRPTALYGRTFDFNPEPNRSGLPPFYALDAWIWKPNPSGLLFAWNPNVSCG